MHAAGSFSQGKMRRSASSTQRKLGHSVPSLVQAAAKAAKRHTSSAAKVPGFMAGVEGAVETVKLYVA